MISINIFYDKSKFLKEMVIEGHAGIKNEDGYEVCIAISTISQAMVYALEDAISIMLVKIKRKNGYLRFVCKTDKLENYDSYVYGIISKAFIDSIKVLAKQYKCYIDYKEHTNIEEI